MSEKDFAVSSVGLPQVGQVSKKPCYLVTLYDNQGAKKSISNFIAMDKPDLQMGFIQVKGIYSDETETDIAMSFATILASTPKEQILDLQIPTHRVHCIRSLVFNANKPSTLVK